MSERIAKVNKLLKQEVGKLILEEVDFPLDMVVTVIRADTSADLHYGDIYVSVMPQGREEEALQLLAENVYALQQKINRKLSMKPVPMLRFRLDRGGDKADRINELIKENEERDR
jgi:ribosome-binding factor A